MKASSFSDVSLHRSLQVSILVEPRSSSADHSDLSQAQMTNQSNGRNNPNKASSSSSTSSDNSSPSSSPSPSLSLSTSSPSSLSSSLSSATVSAEIRDRFSLIVFLLSQFKVHYLSWLKNPDHLGKYWQRFAPFYNLIVRLPEFAQFGCDDEQQRPLSAQSSRSRQESLNKWIICEAIASAYRYRRTLRIDIDDVRGVRHYVNAKQFKILLVEQDNTHLSDQNLNDEKNQSQTNDEDALDRYEIDGVGRKILGEIALQNDATTYVTLPLDTNRNKFDVNIVLLLIDADNNNLAKIEQSQQQQQQQQREYHCIEIGESSISGFNGYHMRQQFELLIEPGDESSYEMMTSTTSTTTTIEFDLTLQWQIDDTNYERLLASRDAVRILRALPGAVYHLGYYYCNFFINFYRWAATQTLDLDVRYRAIAAFHELALSLPVKFHRSNLAQIFAAMYCGLYPAADLLRDIDARLEHYIPESISIIENVIFIFDSIAIENQISILNRIRNDIGYIVQCRFLYARRLFRMIAQNIGIYCDNHFEFSILPLTLEAIHSLAVLTQSSDDANDEDDQDHDGKNDEHPDLYRFFDPRKPNLGGSSIQSLAKCLIALAVDCVDLAKPLLWQTTSIEHANMNVVRRFVHIIFRSLFNTRTMPFLRAIYHTLLRREVLYHSHLTYFVSRFPSTAKAMLPECDDTIGRRKRHPLTDNKQQ